MNDEYCGGECHGDCGSTDNGDNPCEDVAALHRYIKELQEDLKLTSKKLKALESCLVCAPIADATEIVENCNKIMERMHPKT